MIIKVEELCHSCRKIIGAQGKDRGLTLEEMIPIYHIDDFFKNMSDRDINGMIYSILYENTDCTRCRQLVFSRCRIYG